MLARPNSHGSNFGRKDYLINGIQSAENGGPGFLPCFLFTHYLCDKLPVFRLLFSPSFCLKYPQLKAFVGNCLIFYISVFECLGVVEVLFVRSIRGVKVPLDIKSASSA